MDGKRIQCWSNALQHVPMYFNHLRVIVRYWWEIATFLYPLVFNAPVGVIPLDYLRDFWWVSCRMSRLQYGAKISPKSLTPLSRVHAAMPWFNSQSRRKKMCHAAQRACFEINFSGTQEGSSVSSVICWLIMSSETLINQSTAESATTDWRPAVCCLSRYVSSRALLNLAQANSARCAWGVVVRRYARWDQVAQEETLSGAYQSINNWLKVSQFLSPLPQPTHPTYLQDRFISLFDQRSGGQRNTYTHTHTHAPPMAAMGSSRAALQYTFLTWGCALGQH